MQLLILNVNGMIWGVGNLFNWNYMKKYLEFFFFKVLWEKKYSVGGEYG